MPRFRHAAWAVVCALAVSGGADAQLAGTLVVANKSGDTLSFLDLALEKEVARVAVGRAPHEVAISPDGATVLVGEYGPDLDHGGTVAVVDVATARVTDRIDVGEATRPHSPRFLPDGRRFVVTLQERDELAVVDLASKRVLRTLPTGGRESHMVRVSPDGETAFVTARLGEGTLSIVPLEGGEAAAIVTGAGAEGLAVTPDGAEVWVLDRDASRISIVDVGRREVVHRIETPPSPNRIEIGAGGRAVFTNGTSSEELVQHLNVYDVATRERLQEVEIRGGEPDAGAFGILIQGENLFISDTNGGRVLLFDFDELESPKVLLSGMEKERPDGMVWSPLKVERPTEQ